MAFVSFEKLSEAVAFLASHLEQDDVEAIAFQCTDSVHDEARAANGSLDPREVRRRAIRELGRRHATLSLRWRYLGRSFPSDASEHKLGGHDKELGHVHVDFARTDGAWQLKEIWICR